MPFQLVEPYPVPPFAASLALHTGVVGRTLSVNGEVNTEIPAERVNARGVETISRRRQRTMTWGVLVFLCAGVALCGNSITGEPGSPPAAGAARAPVLV